MEIVVKKHKKPTETHNEVMTERQIKRRVGEAWAILKNPVFEKGVLLSAELLYYNKDKEKVNEQLRKREYGHYAMFFFGKIDPNAIYVL